MRRKTLRGSPGVVRQAMRTGRQVSPGHGCGVIPIVLPDGEERIILICWRRPIPPCSEWHPGAQRMGNRIVTHLAMTPDSANAILISLAKVFGIDLAPRKTFLETIHQRLWKGIEWYIWNLVRK